MTKNLLRTIKCAIGVAAVLLTFVENSFATNSKPVSVSADIGIEWKFLQFVNSTNPNYGQLYYRPLENGGNTWLNGFWMQNIKTTLSLTAELGDNILVKVRNYGSVGYKLPPANQLKVYQARGGGGGIEEMLFEYHTGGIADSASPFFTVGYFPVEYTHANQQLGSYFFRAGISPGVITQTYDQKPVFGAKLSMNLPATLRHDLMVVVERDEPANDITLAYLGRLGLGGLNISAGGMLYRVLRTDQGWYKYTQSRRSGDLKDYPKDGIKLMGRLSFDIKSLIGDAKWVGKKGLLVYGEAAILGVQNRGKFYNKIEERIPVMGGITLPTGGLLDIAGIELEYYGSRWRNDITHYSVPYFTFESDDNATFNKVDVDNADKEDGGIQALEDDIKWAVYVEKSFREKIAICVHAASDHIRASDGGYELLHGPKEWYWQVMVKTLF